MKGGNIVATYFGINLKDAEITAIHVVGQARTPAALRSSYGWHVESLAVDARCEFWSAISDDTHAFRCHCVIVETLAASSFASY